MGWKLARCGYWVVIVLGTVLLFGREQEFHINSLWRRSPRRFLLGVLQLLPADAQGSRVHVC